jgi:hypothetical protein
VPLEQTGDKFGNRVLAEVRRNISELDPLVAPNRAVP